MPGEAQSVWKFVSYWETSACVRACMCECMHVCVCLCVMFTVEVEALLVPVLLVRLRPFWLVWLYTWQGNSFPLHLYVWTDGLFSHSIIHCL